MPVIIEPLPLPEPGSGTPEDVLRSLRRYVSLILGSPPWEVRVQRTLVKDDERPVGVVEAGLLTTPHSRAGTVNQGDVQKSQAFTVVCYPEIGDTAARAAEHARQIAYILDAGFSRGLVTDDTPPQNIGGPWRVPIYSFEGKPVDGPARKGADTPYAHANVAQSFNVRPIQDAMDETRWTAVANLTLTWWAAGRLPPRAPLATGGLIDRGWKPPVLP